jgi:hypothetical protein
MFILDSSYGGDCARPRAHTGEARSTIVRLNEGRTRSLWVGAQTPGRRGQVFDAGAVSVTNRIASISTPETKKAPVAPM